MKDGKTIISLFLPAVAVAALFAAAWGLVGPETAFWVAGGILLGALVPGGWILARRRAEAGCRTVLERWLQGDMDARVPVRGAAAPGVAGRINALGDLLQERRQDTAGMASALEQLAGRLSSHAETIARDGSVDEVAETVNGAMEELVQAMEGVARSATAAAEASHQADSSADSGKLSMTEAIGAMEATTSEMRRAKAALQELASDSESIGTVLDVIRGIAEQTNMLALNAAIEAARAGEQGRGFAVVADEVRTLASRTQQSTEEINRMIERLQSAARNVGSVVDEGVQQAQACEELIETACISFAEIAGEVATIDQMGSEIRQATELQGTRVQVIRQTVADGLTGTAHQEATDRALEFATELYGLAERLAART